MGPQASATTSASYKHVSQAKGWFSTAENWLDERGKGAWIIAIVLGFVFIWPLGLAILFYTIWSKRMFFSCKKSKQSIVSSQDTHTPSGNSAFNAYRAETIARLEEEQASFENFLTRIREAKDKAEFEKFMDERKQTVQQPN